MKLTAIDDRKPIAVNVRLEAATYDLAQRYKEYAATLGQEFKTDGQLLAAIVDAFVKRGDKDFLTWLRTQQQTGGKAKQKPTQTANGTDLSTASPLAFEDAQK